MKFLLPILLLFITGCSLIRFSSSRNLEYKRSYNRGNLKGAVQYSLTVSERYRTAFLFKDSINDRNNYMTSLSIDDCDTIFHTINGKVWKTQKDTFSKDKITSNFETTLIYKDLFNSKEIVFYDTIPETIAPIIEKLESVIFNSKWVSSIDY